MKLLQESYLALQEATDTHRHCFTAMARAALRFPKPLAAPPLLAVNRPMRPLDQAGTSISTPKLHYLFSFACKFMDMHGSIGMFSEERTERVHVEWNITHSNSLNNKKKRLLSNMMTLHDEVNTDLSFFLAIKSVEFAPRVSLEYPKRGIISIVYVKRANQIPLRILRSQ